MTRPLIIYHGNCQDGFGAAWCFWRKYGDGADYHPGIYQNPAPNVAGLDVYLVDFSYKRSVVEAMLGEARTITILDHHKSAAEDLDGIGVHHQNLDAVFDMDRSGAVMAWDYLFPDEPRPLLLGHIQDRDLWRFKLAGTREVSADLFSREYKFEQWDKLMSAGQVELLQMTVAGAAIERKHHKDVAELVKTCRRRMVIGGFDIPVASLPYTLVSDAAHLMAQGEKFAACYWDTATGRTFGLRAADDGIDVSKVAASYGGGGHAKAAGFTVPRDHELARS